MNDAERWRTVAAWFEEAAATGDFTEDRVRSGLCRALKIAQGADDYNSNVHTLVMNVVGWHGHDYRTTDGAGWRACLALLMAHMAEDDGGDHRNERE